ncbi:hypothetical protein TNCV_4357421 [Trichonephila clavipes]|nr:hypothetical protein TNCV_4357421 [Trichonephila clavipes]
MPLLYRASPYPMQNMMPELNPFSTEEKFVTRTRYAGKDIGLIHNGRQQQTSGLSLRNPSKTGIFRNFAKLFLTTGYLPPKRKSCNEIPFMEFRKMPRIVEDSTMWNYRAASGSRDMRNRPTLHYGCVSSDGRSYVAVQGQSDGGIIQHSSHSWGLGARNRNPSSNKNGQQSIAGSVCRHYLGLPKRSLKLYCVEQRISWLTDHNPLSIPLTQCQHPQMSEINVRGGRWAIQIRQVTLQKASHMKGDLKLVNADTLSRL